MSHSARMAEPRFNNPYFWPPPPTMPSQLDNLVLINKIKEQLMAEKIRPPHLPPSSVPSQQPLLIPSSPAESSQSVMSLQKLQQVPGLHPQAVPQPDVALHARPATSTVTGNLHYGHSKWGNKDTYVAGFSSYFSGLGLSSRTNVSTSESSTGTTSATPSTPTSNSQTRLIATSPTLISGITSSPTLDSIKTIQGHGLLGPTKPERGRKKIKAENPPGPPVLVVPYPILASGDIGKEGKTYRCKVCPLTFFTKSEMQIHSKSHTEAKPHKCPHCSKSFANASYLAQHLRIHLGVKPYHCSYCEKSFRQLSHLQQHTRIHTGDRPYKCPQPGCEKAFTQLSNLQSHQRQHNKDKPYKCPNCYRAYSDSASLQIHLSAHAVKHAKAYCCSMCGRAYTSETYLMKHMSKHTVVEHLVNHHSPQRTESPGIPVRISLI
ncbi:zinc finger 362 [Pelobates cultripes]|uniref:Zinc finger 362 n=1 Tax=Pelobates cultripes TaxID=61616 RepID=A0AAD1T8S2_PELCU|nr:zinc finger 362 [Pelobates cultripes]